jgi:hypothetical protein
MKRTEVGRLRRRRERRGGDLDREKDGEGEAMDAGWGLIRRLWLLLEKAGMLVRFLSGCRIWRFAACGID